MRTLSIRTPTHGRVLIADRGSPAGLVVAFHGYGQAAEEMLEEVQRIPGADRWQIASVQALHRFYTRSDRRVVASWMTRQDRDAAIADNVEYVARVTRELRRDEALPLVFVGFSQGASMAYRAAALGADEASGVIALAGDIPPEVRAGVAARAWPRVLVGAGRRDDWYTAAKVDEDEAVLEAAGATYAIARFDGGHEWTSEFRAEAGRMLEDIAAAG